MAEFLNRLGVNSTSKASRNVWLSSLFIFLLLGMNYMTLIMSEMLLICLTIGLALLGFISLTVYTHLTIKEWPTISSDKRIGKILYIGLLTSVMIFISAIPIKLMLLKYTSR